MTQYPAAAPTAGEELRWPRSSPHVVHHHRRVSTSMRTGTASPT
jgi:hypothetical protein